MLEVLQNRYGEEALELVGKGGADKYGLYSWHMERTLAKKSESNTLEVIAKHFAGGDESRLIKKSEKEVLIKTTECLTGKIAQAIGRGETLYRLHCGLDKYQVEGFNERLGCEVINSIMEGHEYCMYRLFIKEE